MSFGALLGSGTRSAVYVLLGSFLGLLVAFMAWLSPPVGASVGHHVGAFSYDAANDFAQSPGANRTDAGTRFVDFDGAAGPALSVSARSHESARSLVAPSGLADDVVGAACSFSADTEVLMADGTTRPISQIEVGDRVLAEDPETGERGAREVTHLWVHDDMVVDLAIDGRAVATTEDHPFWNQSDNRWQRADVLDPGDLVLTADGALLTVGGVDWGSARTATAYNLTVDDIHTYFVAVGGQEVLVHNTCPWQLKFDANFGNHVLDGPLPQTGQLADLTRGELLDLQADLTTSIANRQQNLWDGTFPTVGTQFENHAARVDLEIGLLRQVNDLLG